MCTVVVLVVLELVVVGILFFAFIVVYTVGIPGSGTVVVVQHKNIPQLCRPVTV